MLLLILTHVDTRHHRLVVEQVFGQCLGQFRFTYTCGAEENERGDRSLRVLQAGTRAANGIRDGGDGLVLADNTLMQFLFQVQQFLTFTLHHAGDGDACPATDHLGDVVCCDFLAD